MIFHGSFFKKSILGATLYTYNGDYFRTPYRDDYYYNGRGRSDVNIGRGEYSKI